MTDAAAFESALQQNPDDLATWCAYADHLTARGDPRGAFMQLQLALEDESRPKEERAALQERERQLLAQHQRAWLGEFAPYVLDQEPRSRNAQVRFIRGWLMEVSAERFSVEMARALDRALEAQLLAQLLVRGTEWEVAANDHKDPRWEVYEPGPDVPVNVKYYDAPAHFALRQCSRLAGLRVFCYGDGTAEPGGMCEELRGGCNGSVIHEAIARMPRIEELYLYSFNANARAVFAFPMPHLRILHLDHVAAYPFEVLAANPSLGRLTHLLCHPHAQRFDDPRAYIRLEHLRAVCRSPHLTSLQHLRLLLTDFGDDGAEEIVASGVLKRLKVLDLSYGCMRDAGARRLAACPDLKNLSLLDLTMNALTPDGVAALAATGVPLKTGEQHGEHPDQLGIRGWLEYLSHGDIE